METKKHTVREWIEFLNNEENATFCIAVKDGYHYRKYKPFKDIIETYGKDWLDAIPVEVWYNNNYKGGTLLLLDSSYGE